MKKFAFVLLFGAILAPAFAQNIATWTFETSQPITAGPLAPEVGAGAASIFHSGSSTYSSPAGNGSAHSFSSNTWSTGDYYQFSVSTVGSSNIAVSWDQTSSGTGPRDFVFQYSLNGTTFTNALTYTVLTNGSPNAAWSASTAHPEFSFSANLSAVASLNNQTTVYFRLMDASAVSANGGSVGTAGTDRVDNFSVSATAPIPEPSTYALMIGLAGLALAVRRRSALGFAAVR